MDDCISRQAVLGLIGSYGGIDLKARQDMLKIIQKMPSVTPTERTGCDYCKHKNDTNSEICLECEDDGVTRGYTRFEPTERTGHWIKSKDQYGNFHYECSECGNDIATQSDYSGDNYCLECGARMVEPLKSEE